VKGAPACLRRYKFVSWKDIISSAYTTASSLHVTACFFVVFPDNICLFRLNGTPFIKALSGQK